MLRRLFTTLLGLSHYQLRKPHRIETPQNVLSFRNSSYRVRNRDNSIVECICNVSKTLLAEFLRLLLSKSRKKEGKKYQNFVLCLTSIGYFVTGMY